MEVASDRGKQSWLHVHARDRDRVSKLGARLRPINQFCVHVRFLHPLHWRDYNIGQRSFSRTRVRATYCDRISSRQRIMHRDRFRGFLIANSTIHRCTEHSCRRWFESNGIFLSVIAVTIFYVETIGKWSMIHFCGSTIIILTEQRPNTRNGTYDRTRYAETAYSDWISSFLEIVVDLVQSLYQLLMEYCTFFYLFWRYKITDLPFPFKNEYQLGPSEVQFSVPVISLSYLLVLVKSCWKKCATELPSGNKLKHT